jgi:hypothetical protein
VVEGARLESVCRGNSTEGSNPSLSAIRLRSPSMKASVAVIVLAIPFTAARGVPAANDTPTLKSVLSRAGAYVVRFERDLATLVAEEHYIQEVLGTASTEHRELRSDLLFVSKMGTHRYVEFRDVFEVDGRTLRERDERLTQLASRPSDVSMGQIVTESARYNIGDIERTINVPLLPLMFLIPENQGRFRFGVQKGQTPLSTLKDLPPSPYFTVSTEVWVIEYHEVERPTIIRFADRRKDIPARGRFWIEPASGRVLMSELIAEDRTVHATIDVSYQSEPVLDLLVPIEMRETYWRADQPTRITGIATYSRFRRLSAR